MDPGNEHVQRQLRELADRVETIERRLGIVVAHQSEASPVPPPLPPSVVIEERPLSERVDALRRMMHAQDHAPAAQAPTQQTTPLAPPTSPPIAPPTAPQIMPPIAPPAFAGVRTQPPPAPRPPAPRLAPTPPLTPRPAKQSDFSLESLVGGRLFLGIGALIVVVGVGLGLKLGVDKGWFTMPPALRCGAAAMFGLLLIAGAEFARRKINVLASTGLFAAGIAILFTSVFAAWGMYELIEAPTAFTLLVCVCALGIGIGLRASSLAIGVLSLVGAYLTPLIFHASHSSPFVLPTYLLALLALGLVLAGWRPTPFRAMRGVAWWGTVLVGTGWLLSSGRAEPLIALAFLGLVWLCVHAELYLGSRREPEAKAVPFGPKAMMPRLTRPIISSFATTLWSVGFGVIVIQMGSSVIPAWGIPAAGFLGTLCLAMVLAGNLRIFQDAPETDAERLGAGLWMQAAGLAIVTLALGLSGWTQVVAWLGMGLAAVAAGKWLKARSLDVYGLIVLSIALARLIAFDSWNTPSGGIGVFGLHLTRWTLLMAFAGIAWLASAALLQRPATATSSRRRVLIDVCLGIGCTIVAMGSLSEKSAIPAIIGVGAVLGGVLAWVATMRSSRVLQGWTFVALLGAMMAAMIGQFNDMRLPLVFAKIGTVIISDFSVALLVVATCWFLASWLFKKFTTQSDTLARTVMIALGVLASLLAWCAPESSMPWACVLWGVTGIACGIAAFLARGGARGLRIDAISVGTLVAAALLWSIAFVLPWTTWNDSAAGIGMHPGLWVALGIIGALLVIPWNLKRYNALSWVMVASIAAAVAGVLALSATSLEVARGAMHLAGSEGTAQRAAVSIWWGLFAVGLIVLGFMRAVPLTRHAGLALLGIATVKAVVFDLAGVAPEWRVVSFIGLGLLMLGVAIGYARIAKRMADTTPPPSPAPPLSTQSSQRML